jgi:hypothetical protein
MRLPLEHARALPSMPETEEEAAQERAYCDEIARRLLEYELDPRHFVRKRVATKLRLS